MKPPKIIKHATPSTVEGTDPTARPSPMPVASTKAVLVTVAVKLEDDNGATISEEARKEAFKARKRAVDSRYPVLASLGLAVPLVAA